MVDKIVRPVDTLKDSSHVFKRSRGVLGGRRNEWLLFLCYHCLGEV